MNLENPQYVLFDLSLENVKIRENLCLDKANFDTFKCNICKCLPIEPKYCGDCGSLTCSRCTSMHLINSSKCPNSSCSKQFKEDPIPRLVQSLLNNLSIKCPSSTDCLDSELKYVDLRNHLVKCKHTKRIARCSGCLQDVTTTNELKEIQYHIKRCPKIQVYCKHCAVAVTRAALKDHYENCPEFTITCQNCSANYKKVQQELHIQSECINNLKTLYEAKKKEGKFIFIFS
jgi:hypothetical protein